MNPQGYPIQKSKRGKSISKYKAKKGQNICCPQFTSYSILQLEKFDPKNKKPKK